MAPIGSASSPTWPSLRSSSPPSLPRPRCSRSRKTSVRRPLADSASPHLPTGGSLEERVKRLATLPLNFQPGTQCEYSPGTGFDTLGRVIEILSGMNLDQFFRTRIFEPRGMKDTFWAASVTMAGPARAERISGSIPKNN